MEYFKKYFSDIDEKDWLAEEVKVRCPFHDDTKPSASINTVKNLFHCWVDNIGYNEEQFIAKINNIPTTEAIKLLDNDNSAEFVTETSLPFKIAGAIKTSNQAQFHPRKYMYGLVKAIQNNGGLVFTNALVSDIQKYESGYISYANDKPASVSIASRQCVVRLLITY